jgi:hypothetical protein
MRIKTTSIYSFIFFIIFHSNLATALNPESDLIKVTAETDSKCVVYYHYKGALYCSKTATTSNPVDPQLKNEENLEIVFDDRPWQMAWGTKKSNITTIEYIPLGDDINNWKELITSQFFPNLQKVTPKQFAERFVQQFKDAGYNPIVSYIEESPEKVIGEVRISEPKNQAQDELFMITLDDNGLYMLHYAIKQADMGEKNREKWVKNLINSSIKPA